MEKKEYTYHSISKELLARPSSSHCIGKVFREIIYQRALEIEFEDTGTGERRVGLFTEEK